MTPTSSIKRERYFVIKTNGIIEEYNSFDDAAKQGDRKLLIIDKFKEFYTPLGGYDWRISNYEFFIDKDKQTKLICNNWTVEVIDITSKTSNNLDFIVTFSDPLKRIRRFPFAIKRRMETSNSHDLEIVVMTLDELNKLSKYHNWEQIDLVSENEKLKTRNSELLAKLTKGGI
jgi:hypothetical protein